MKVFKQPVLQTSYTTLYMLPTRLFSPAREKRSFHCHTSDGMAGSLTGYSPYLNLLYVLK